MPTPVKVLDYFFLWALPPGMLPAQDVRQAAACLAQPGPGGAPTMRRLDDLNPGDWSDCFHPHPGSLGAWESPFLSPVF